MRIQMGVIADDVTGATDIASFLVKNGFRTVQINGEQLRHHAGSGPWPVPDLKTDVDAVVISLKNRSNPADEATAKARRALTVLRTLGAEQFYFKYCSTFDSTEQGNIGPVTDAMMRELEVPLTVVAPALPVNGRTVYSGYLFVNGVPLHESGMRHHPLTPMTDSSIKRLMEAQSDGTADVIGLPTVEAGVDAVRDRLAAMAQEGVRYAILDALNDVHLRTLGEAVSDLPLVTGGSGLGGSIAQARTGRAPKPKVEFRGMAGPSVVLSGSCSERTQAQVARYITRAPVLRLDVDRAIHDPEAYVSEVTKWFWTQDTQGLAPLISATTDSKQLREAQARYGAAAAGEAIESLIGSIARDLVDGGVRNLIVAGGESSGAVTSALQIEGFEVGPEIAPGVPVVRTLDHRISLVLKSGNFGGENFFFDAQKERHE